MATTGILTISSISGRFNHRFVGNRSSVVFQLPAVGDWLQWCNRHKHPLHVDSFLSFVHQVDSSLLHELTGVTPSFGDDTAEGMKKHFDPFLMGGSVRNVFHVDVFGGVFRGVTHLERVVTRHRSVWDVSSWSSVEAVHADSVRVCRDAAEQVRAEGYTQWQVDPEGAALDFEDTAKRHEEFVSLMVGA